MTDVVIFIDNKYPLAMGFLIEIAIFPERSMRKNRCDGVRKREKNKWNIEIHVYQNVDQKSYLYVHYSLRANYQVGDK